ncbi:heme exporter protein CcmB [Natronospora cellulosivora (SeqCode)]
MKDILLYLKQIKIIVLKDLKIEFRKKDMIASVIVFAFLVVLVFAFVFDSRAINLEYIFPGLIWVIFIFSGIMALNRSFNLEKNNNSIYGLMLCPLDKSVIYFAKLLANLIYMFIIEGLSLFFLIVIFNYEMTGSFLALIIVVSLGTFAFVAIGTFLAALSSNLSGSEVLFPVIFLPMFLPILIAALELTTGVLEGKEIIEMAFWLRLLIVYNILFIVVPFVLFDFLMEV